MLNKKVVVITFHKNKTNIKLTIRKEKEKMSNNFALQFSERNYCYCYRLLGNLERQSHEIFDPRLFHQSILLGSLINRLNHFCIWLRIYRERSGDIIACATRM
jgi:hypothetical protein